MRIKNFFKEMWRHLGFWANPTAHIMAAREANWRDSMLKISHMCYEYGMDGQSARGLEEIRAYIRRKLEEMGYG